MPDSEFAATVHAANDAGFIVDAHMRHSSGHAKNAGLPGDIFEVVIRRRMSVFWIGDSLDRAEIQALAAAQLAMLIRDYPDADA